MNAIARVTAADLRQHRAVIAVSAAILLVVLSVPVGLSALRSGSPLTGSASSGVGASDLSKQYDTSAGSAAGVGAPGAAPESAPKAVTGGAPRTAPEAAPAVVDAKLARTAWLGVKVTNLSAGSARVRTIALAAGGIVVSENVASGNNPTDSNGGTPAPSSGGAEIPVPPVGLNEARITVSVPADKLDAVIADLSSATLGTVAYHSSNSVDVTDTYIDTQARIQPAKDSIERVRALMIKATTLDQIVMLESELSRRQSDLDSLQQRLAELDRRTTMSEVSVTLWTDDTAPTQPDENGVLAGLRKAWEALLASAMVVVTGLAVLLPWLFVGLVVAWFARRWLHGRRAPATSASD